MTNNPSHSASFPAATQLLTKQTPSSERYKIIGLSTTPFNQFGLKINIAFESVTGTCPLSPAPEDFTRLKNCISNVIDQYNYQVNKGGFESSKNW